MRSERGTTAQASGTAGGAAVAADASAVVAVEADPDVAAALRGPAGSAWVAIADPSDAASIGAALQAAGWRVDALAHDVATLQRLLSLRALPDVVVASLRYEDGDGLQLIRALARTPQPPAVFVASRQQRSVIKAAAALAQACGLPWAGSSEQPALDAASIAARVAQWRRPPGQPQRAAGLTELTRDELLALFEQGTLGPWMQPKMRLATHEIVGFEALMRAHDGQGRLLMPDRLIGALMRHQLLDIATLDMARKAVGFAAQCLQDGMGISVSINVSMQSLSSVAFCQQLVQTVEQAGVDPSWVTIEITETEAMADPASVIENTARVRMLGFNLAIDDFGTAYSSLLQLSRIPFSELKIERAFVSDAPHDPGRQAIVRACAQLGQSLGLHVVAEGVETEAELDFVRHAGCSAAQGCLIARPMPVDRAVQWLRGLDDLRFTAPGG